VSARIGITCQSRWRFLSVRRATHRSHRRPHDWSRL